MNWIAIHLNPDWQSLWRSDEIRKHKEALQHTLLYAKLDPESRGIVRGQLQHLDFLQNLVKLCADKQAKESIKQAAESTPSLTTTEDFFRDLPRVF